MCDDYLLMYRKHSPLEDVDAGNDYTDYGEEWPAFEGEEAARQREFNQVRNTTECIVKCNTVTLFNASPIVLVWCGARGLPY